MNSQAPGRVHLVSRVQSMHSCQPFFGINNEEHGQRGCREGNMSVEVSVIAGGAKSPQLLTRMSAYVRKTRLDQHPTTEESANEAQSPKLPNQLWNCGKE